MLEYIKNLFLSFVNVLLLPVRIFRAVFEDRDGYVSRKLAAAWLLSCMVTFLIVLHIPIEVLFEIDIDQIVLSDNYITFLIAIWGSYFTADVVGSWIHTGRDQWKALQDERKKKKLLKNGLSDD